VGSDAHFTVEWDDGHGDAGLTTHTLADGECEVVHQWFEGSTVEVTVTEQPAAGFVLDHIRKDPGGEILTQNPLTGYFAGITLTYVNVPERHGAGCTPGYWKNHLDAWAATGFAPGDGFDATFGTSYFGPSLTLGQAVGLGGAGLKKLARHGTAALLSAAHPGVDYPFSVAQVIALVQANNVEPLVAANELGCPLN
jgi:hypothetical protein